MVLKDASSVFQAGVSYSMKKISSILSKWQEGLRLDRGTFIHTFSVVSTQRVEVYVHISRINVTKLPIHLPCSFIKSFLLSLVSTINNLDAFKIFITHLKLFLPLKIWIYIHLRIIRLNIHIFIQILFNVFEINISYNISYI